MTLNDAELPSSGGLSALSSILVRLGGAAAILGGVAWVALLSPGKLLFKLLKQFGLLRESVFSVDNMVFVTLFLGTAAAVAALHALQRRHYGWVGTLASSAAFAGLVMLAVYLIFGYGAEAPDGDPFLAFLNFLLTSGLLLSTVGLIALGIATIRAGAMPWWCGAALIAGSPPVGIGLSAFMWVAGEAVVAPVGIAWILVGCAVLRADTLPVRSVRL